jgi:type IV secretion system protein VirB8
MKSGKRTYLSDNQTQVVQLGGANKLKQERNRAYLFIGLLLFVVGGMASAIVVLASIHTVVPVVSVIDGNGHVVKQQVVDKETIVGQESVVQSQVYDFVMCCNTFDPDWRQRYADLCRLHSTKEVASQYDAETSPDNPNNPYYQIGQGGRRYPKITGITSLGKEAYQVSFQSITEKPGSPPTTDYYTALVHYAFTFKPLALGDRWENALGFVATAYRKDQELSRR